MENINFSFDNLNIAQLGFVYRDVRKQAKWSEQFFGISNFNILGPVELDTIYRGKDTKYTVIGAFGKLFNNVEVELIQFVDGESIHKEFLNQGREGLHHIRYDLESLQDFKTVLEEFNDKGINVLQYGKIVSSEYAYLDTEDLLGIILEFSAAKRKRR